MSLFIVGSASRVTSNIVMQLARNAQYSSVTIADLLPSYDNYHRYYRLQKDLDHLKLNNFSLSIQKLFETNQLYEQAKYDDVLFVTHDYYQSVTSKTKLMRMVAQVCKKRSHLFFATPLEYDHFGFSNPQNNYLQTERTVIEIAPQSTIIRSNVQDKGEAIAYINKNKGFIDGQVFNLYSSNNFAPKIVSSYAYAEIVAKNMKERVQGKRILVDGSVEVKPAGVDFQKSVESHEYEHSKINIASLTSKYNGIIGENCETVIA